MPDEHPSLGEYLKAERLEQGRSIRTVGGDELGPSYIHQLESDSFDDVHVRRLIEICNRYGVSLTQVLADVYGVEFTAD